MSARFLLLLCAAPVGWGLQRWARRLAGAELPLAAWVGGAALATLAALFSADRPLLPSLALVWTLLALGVIDTLTLRLPDALTLPLALAGFVVTALDQGDTVAHAAAGAVAFAVFAGLDWAYLRLRGRHGLGLGDAKLMAAAGAWLGWRPLPAVLLLACAGGLAWAACRMLKRRSTTAADPLPFGAPLCLSIGVAWMTHMSAT